MTLYLTDRLPVADIAAPKASGLVHAVKYYPAGATTNSDAGVTRISMQLSRRSKQWNSTACRC